MIEVDNAREALEFVDSLNLPATSGGDARAHAIIQSLVVAGAITAAADKLAKAIKSAAPSDCADDIRAVAKAVELLAVMLTPPVVEASAETFA